MRPKVLAAYVKHVSWFRRELRRPF